MAIILKYCQTLEADTTPLKLIEYVAKGHIALHTIFLLNLNWLYSLVLWKLQYVVKNERLHHVKYVYNAMLPLVFLAISTVFQ